MARIWTKTTERQWLDAAIRDLGPHSYLGPWLAEYRDALVAAIDQDLPPEAPLPSVARQEGAALLAAARDEADRLTRQAREHAQGLLDGTREQIRELRENARRHLAGVASRL